jgi:DNA-binding transcriptional MerR regulator
MDNARTQASFASGEFGRLSGLSIKALRLYDLSGLLTPEAVDPVTGYRRYAAAQLDRARRISLLRQLDMPLATIAELLEGTDEEAADRLDRWWAGQEASHRDRRGSYDFLRAHLIRGAASWATHPVLLADVPDTKLASIRRVVDQAALVPAIIEGEGEIRAFLHRAGATAADGEVLCGQSWVIYHGLVSPDSEAEIEIALPFQGSVEPAGRVAIRIEPAHTVAACVITRGECSYPQIMLAYEDVALAVPKLGAVIAGPPREVYLGDPDRLSAEQPFAQVVQPVLRVS